MNRVYLIILLLLFYVVVTPTHAKDRSWQYVIPKPGSVVTLKRSLTVPPGTTKVYLQRGQVVRRGNVDRFYPSCNFEVLALRQKPTGIRADTFKVTKTVRDIDYMVQNKSQPYQYAGMKLSSYDDGGAAMIIHVVHMRLKSSRQPNVYRLTCRSWEDLEHEAKEPNIRDMKEALGGYARIRLR